MWNVREVRDPPAALTASFGDHAAKPLQWQGFLNKSGIEAEGLAETVSLLQTLLWPATQVAAAKGRERAGRRPRRHVQSVRSAQPIGCTKTRPVVSPSDPTTSRRPRKAALQFAHAF